MVIRVKNNSLEYTPSEGDSFGTLKAPSSQPTLMLRVGVPLEEGTVPSGRLIVTCHLSLVNCKL